MLNIILYLLYAIYNSNHIVNLNQIRNILPWYRLYKLMAKRPKWLEKHYFLYQPGYSWIGRQKQAIYPTEPRSRSVKSAADTTLEKTSLSAGGFQWVPYGYMACSLLRDWLAIWCYGYSSSKLLPIIDKMNLAKHMMTVKYWIWLGPTFNWG